MKFCLDPEATTSGCRIKTKEIYSSDSLGNQRLLIPAGGGTWDLWIHTHVLTISGNETDQELRALAEVLPHTYVERMAPTLIKNVTYVFTVGKFTSKFVRSRSRLLGNWLHHRFWFFSAALGESQIIARIRSLAGRIYAARAVKIVEACARKHVKPYKDLKRTVDLFSLIGSRLRALGDRLLVRMRFTARAAIQKRPAASPVRTAAILSILSIAQNNLPDLYQDFQVLYAMTCRGPAGPLGAPGGVPRAAA